MNRRLIVTADDYGLSRGINESILSAVDNGALNSVSILANGEDVSYALAAHATRPGLRLSVHLNLTEGPALSPLSRVPHLVDGQGMFTYTPARLLLAYTLSFPARRRKFREEVAYELGAQWERVRSSVHVDAADGHQHVHMIPFVFDIVLALPGVAYVRVPTEPLYYVPGNVGMYIGNHALARFLFLFFGKRNRIRALARGIETSDYVLGVMFSGRMTLGGIAAGLAALQSYVAGTVELIFHPGEAKSSELRTWRDGHADIVWHLSQARAAERKLLMSGEFQLLLENTRKTAVGSQTLDPWRIVRFLVSGTVAALTTLVLLYILTEWLFIWYLYSATIAFSISIVVSFSLQKFWTFGASGGVTTQAQLTRFVFLNMGNIVLNTLGVYVFTELGMWYIIAEFFTAILIAVSSFVIMRRFIFAT